jgi:hypothetical protein
VGVLALLCGAVGGQEAENPVNREQIDAALKLTQAAAREYQFTLAGDEQECDLKPEPVLRWSNPAVGEIHGNVFLWTQRGRPAAIGSLFKWFTPHTHMSHEFQSLSEKPLGAKFHGADVWKTSGAGVQFAPVPQAPSPAASAASRLVQLKQLAREFSATKKERDGGRGELRLLTQPIYRYASPEEAVLDGGLFAFVQGTDPELFLLLEARGGKQGKARWEFAATRMNSVELQLRHRGTEVWAVKAMPWREIYDHRRIYTSFLFKEIPAFLSEAAGNSAP